MTHHGMGLTLGVLLLLTAEACERQGAPPKPVGAATNKHVEEAPASPPLPNADTTIQHLKTPLDNARKTEELLKESADRTRQQSDSTP